MKYIKTYEQTHFLEDELDLSDECTYLINGKLDEQIKIIKKLQEKCYPTLTKDLDQVLLNLCDRHAIGIVLCYNRTNYFGFYEFYEVSDIADILFGFYKDRDFKGELLIKNDQIYLDRSVAFILKNTKKYNL